MDREAWHAAVHGVAKSWTIKKAEHQKIDAFEMSRECMFLGFCLITTKIWSDGTMVLEKTLESPLDCKEIQPVHSKGDQSWDFFGRNDAKAETPVLWPPHAES